MSHAGKLELACQVLEGIPAFHYTRRDSSTKLLAYKSPSIRIYSLVTRAYLPRLIPVEVDEPIAKVWFKSLLSGVEFLHIRGVVHNDIKWVFSCLELRVTLNIHQASKYSAFG